jgi:hypothetical protein
MDRAAKDHKKDIRLKEQAARAGSLTSQRRQKGSAFAGPANSVSLFCGLLRLFVLCKIRAQHEH